MASWTEQRVMHRYELMDFAYDAKEIKEFIIGHGHVLIGHGHVPIIDINTRNNIKLCDALAEEAMHRS